MVDISVVVVSYNPDYYKLFRTLYSIINQKDINFEIIVADDGSKDFQKGRIEKWFGKIEFTDYKIICNKENKGTVCNALSGSKVAQGRYIKQLSPGDFLYDDTVLNRLVSHLLNNDISLCFGKVISYKLDLSSENIELVNFCAPKDLKPYKRHNKKGIQKNYLIYRDYANGMAFVGKTELIKKYLQKLVGYVKYAEDCIFILMVADGVELFYWEEYIIWYEHGSGISTSQSNIWEKRIYNDNKECFKIIKNEIPKWRKAYEINFEKSMLYYFYKLKRKLKYKMSFTTENHKNIDLFKLKKILKNN